MEFQQSNVTPMERPEGTSLWTMVQAHRARLNMRLLGASPMPNTASGPIKEGRPTYREHFVPPAMSIVSYLLVKVNTY